MLQKIKDKLKEKNVSEDKIDEIANEVLEKINSKSKKLDEDGHIIIGENVKFVISANITSTGEVIKE